MNNKQVAKRVNGSANGTPEVPEIFETLIEVPWSHASYAGYYSNTGTKQINVHRLTPKQQRNLKRLFNGLYNSRQTLDSGDPVVSHQGAIKWILENLDFGDFPNDVTS